MQHIQNGQSANEDMLKYRYRKMFGLSAEQYEREPIDEVHIALFINGEVEKQRAREMKHGN